MTEHANTESLADSNMELGEEKRLEETETQQEMQLLLGNTVPTLTKQPKNNVEHRECQGE